MAFGSLPRGTEKSAPHLTPGQAFAVADHSLDRLASGSLWLKDRRVANLVSHTVLIGASERRFYDLCAWVVMPNQPRTFVDPPAGFGSSADAVVEGIDGQGSKPDTGQNRAAVLAG